MAKKTNPRFVLVTPEPFVLKLPPGASDEDIQEVLDSLTSMDGPCLGSSGWKDISQVKSERFKIVPVQEGLEVD